MVDYVISENYKIGYKIIFYQQAERQLQQQAVELTQLRTQIELSKGKHCC